MRAAAVHRGPWYGHGIIEMANTASLPSSSSAGPSTVLAKGSMYLLKRPLPRWPPVSLLGLRTNAGCAARVTMCLAKSPCTTLKEEVLKVNEEGKTYRGGMATDLPTSNADLRLNVGARKWYQCMPATIINIMVLMTNGCDIFGYWFQTIVYRYRHIISRSRLCMFHRACS